MLDAKKIHLMTELARYENEQGKENLKISHYYRSDYIGIGLLKNLLLISVGYMLIWGLIVAYNLDFVLDNVHKIDFSMLIFEVVLGYLIIMVPYLIVVYIKRFAHYEKAKKSVEAYYEGLDDLMRMYGTDSDEIVTPKHGGGDGK